MQKKSADSFDESCTCKKNLRGNYNMTIKFKGRRYKLTKEGEDTITSLLFSLSVGIVYFYLIWRWLFG